MCAAESWDMKDDRSSRHKGKHSLSVSHTREGGKVELVEDLRGSHAAKDRTGRWRRGGGTQVRGRTELGGISVSKRQRPKEGAEVFSRSL